MKEWRKGSITMRKLIAITTTNNNSSIPTSQSAAASISNGCPPTYTRHEIAESANRNYVLTANTTNVLVVQVFRISLITNESRKEN